MQHNPKGPDGLRPKTTIYEEWMGRPGYFTAILSDFVVHLEVTPSGRDWEMRVRVPTRFLHKDFKLSDHIGEME